MGIHLENYINYTEDEDILNLSCDELIQAGAIPDISVINDWSKKVKAIIPTHAHLDHLGAIPFLAKTYNAPIFGTPYTMAVLKTILKDEKLKLDNEIKTLTTNAVFTLNSNLTFEFINMTHSTPETVMVAIHTKKGVILYANDFKSDMNPVLGKKPNFKQLMALRKEGVLALIVDSTYAKDSRKMPSESVARELLKDVLLGTDARNQMIAITTFSSHLARIKSIVEFGRTLNRKILFLGRSLSKYIYAGESIGIVNFSKFGRIVRYSKQIKKELNKITPKNRGGYLLILTGHQGEPKASLTKIINDQFDFRFEKGDHVIFSCKVIPTKTNILNREKIEAKLRSKGVRVFRDIHVSGHAAKEDLRDLISLIRPKKIIPAHGDNSMKNALADLAKEEGYNDEGIILMDDGKRVII